MKNRKNGEKLRRFQDFQSDTFTEFRIMNIFSSILKWIEIEYKYVMVLQLMIR